MSETFFTPCTAATFHSVPFSKQNPVWFGKVTPKNCVRFSKPIPVWFGKKNIDFAKRRFQTKFRLVWKVLMTIVNILKIPIRIQFGLEKSLTEYSVQHRSVCWSWHTLCWTSLHCSEVSVVHSRPEDSKHPSFISVEYSEYSVAHSCVISWPTSRSTSLHCSAQLISPLDRWNLWNPFYRIRIIMRKLGRTQIRTLSFCSSERKHNFGNLFFGFWIFCSEV